MSEGLKIAVSGKGGVGKTTLSALLCQQFAKQGKVLAIDADPDANFGMALGFDAAALQSVAAISDDKQLIKERTGAEPGASGQLFTMNPQVSDIPDKYVVVRGNIRLLRMGRIAKAGAGCACAENALVRQLLRHLVLHRDETVIVDMEAGLEHFGRGTADAVDAFLVVVEPGQRSVECARDVVRLARELGVHQVYAVVNKVTPAQREKITTMLDFVDILGYLPYEDAIVDADLNGLGLSECSADFSRTITDISEHLKHHFVEEGA